MDNCALAKMVAMHPHGAYPDFGILPEIRARITSYFVEQSRPVFSREYAGKVLADLFAAMPKINGDNVAPSRRPSGVETIKREVAFAHHLTTNDIESISRVDRVVFARQEAMYRAAQETPLSLPQIGWAFRKHHTTVLHGIRAHARRNNLPLPRGLQQKERAR